MVRVSTILEVEDDAELELADVVREVDKLEEVDVLGERVELDTADV